MNLNNSRHETTAVKPHQYPTWDIPEVSFVGRSNVGKSSLLNTLVNRKNLARVGGTPGKTRQINFYNIDDVLSLVDLPGYGYASVSKAEKESWGKLAETYLNVRNNLKLIVMLVDIRHLPSKDDIIMYKWLKSTNIKNIIVATKLDKIPRSHIQKNVSDIRKAFEIDENVKIIPFSSETRQGKEELWEQITKIADGELVEDISTLQN